MIMMILKKKYLKKKKIYYINKFYKLKYFYTNYINYLVDWCFEIDVNRSNVWPNKFKNPV